MAEIVVEVPGVKLDKKTISELKGDIISVVRLKLARELILKRLDKMLENSELTEEDAMLLGEKAKDNILKEWNKRG